MGPVACVHCVYVKNSGFSQPPAPCSLAAFLESTARTKFDGSAAWRLIQVIVHSPQQETSNQMYRHIRPGRRREHQQEFGLNSNRAYWSLQNRQLESRIFLQNAVFRKMDSPRAKRSPLRPFGESIGRFWRVHFLSGKIVQENSGCPASLAQIAALCFEESILVFMGVRVF